MRRNGVVLLLLMVAAWRAPADIQVKSPGGVLSIGFRLTSHGIPQWWVSGPGGTLLSWSPLGLTFLEGGSLASRLGLVESTILEKDEAYELVVGKTKNARDQPRWHRRSPPVDLAVISDQWYCQILWSTRHSFFCGGRWENFSRGTTNFCPPSQYFLRA